MLVQNMQQHNLITGVWWEPLPSAVHTARTRAVRALRSRSNRKVIYYEVQSADPKIPARQFSGLTEKQSPVFESLALYIRLLYGDGIFHCHNSDGSIWLLIISDGMIMPGTDCMVSPLVFETLMEGLQSSAYKALPVRPLNEESGEEILKHYQASQQQLKKKSYMLWAVLGCCGLALLSIPLIFILTG